MLFLFGCQKDALEQVEEANARIVYDAESEAPLVQFINDPSDTENQNFQTHIRKVTTYAKIPYARVSVKELIAEPVFAASTRVVVITNTKPIGRKLLKELISFVSNGGTVFLPSITEDPTYAFLAGLTPDTDYTISNIAKGFHFKTNFLPGMKGVLYDNKTVHSALLAENFLETITVLATAVNDEGVPTIIKHTLGAGKVISLNSDQEGRKQDRGLYFAALLSGLENIPYPIVNSSTIFIDDFPAPTYPIKREPITSEFNLDEATFYRDIWWPDMVSLANEEQLKYTAMVCFDYRNLDTPPFLFSEWEQATTTVAGNKKITGDIEMENVLRRGDELGLHGYNHISLMTEQWENPDFMQTALLAAQKKWKAGNYGPLPKTYVPPSNDIDSLGLAAIATAFPSLEYHSSLYLGDFNYGGEREFDVEPLNNHFFDFPRITSGYTLDPGTQFDLQSLYLYTGIWTHFIHPDDVYQIPDDSNNSSRGDYEYRNTENLNWKKTKKGEKAMLPRFKAFLKTFKQQYPMVRYLQAKEAATITKSWRNSTYVHNNSETEYSLSVAKNEGQRANFWFVYSSATQSGNLERSFKEQQYDFSKTEVLDGYLYQVKTKLATITVPLLSKKHAPKNKMISPEAQVLLDKYEKYLAGEPYFSTIEEEIAFAANQGKTAKAITLLEQKISAATVVDAKEYEQLYQYYSWNDQEVLFYGFLETQYRQSPTSALVALSRTIAETNDYPNNVLRKVWMERQMKLFPTDVELRKNYLSYFGSEEELQELDLADVERAFNDAVTLQEKAALLPKLLDENSVLLASFLSTLQPCENSVFTDSAHTIAQWYADSEHYVKAIAWSQCTDKISAEILILWRTESGEYAFLKDTNFTSYIQQLIEKNPALLTQELINITPCYYNFNTDMLVTIAYAFADQGSYRSAYQWSSCIENFDVKEQLQWLANMRAIDEMELRYSEYLIENPNSPGITLLMATLYSDLGEISSAWKLASTLTLDVTLEPLRQQLNKDVVYISAAEQEELLNTYSRLFYPEVAAILTKKLRINENDFLVSSSNVLADRLQPTTLTNELGYGRYSKNRNQHIFGITQNRPYALRLDSQEDGNTALELYGIYYSFKSKEKEQTLTYTARSGIEFSDSGTLYYQVEGGVALSKDSLFSSVQLSFKPALTAPAYNLDIYRAQLGLYEEYRFAPRWQLTAGLEGNYYTNKVVDGLLTSTVKYNVISTKRNIITSYAEGAGMLGNTDYSLGYPYWTIEERVYGGIGLGYRYGLPRKELILEVDAATFLDTFSGTFQRYRGTASLPLFEYFYLNFNAEFYTLENFYSNNFTLGLRYHLK